MPTSTHKLWLLFSSILLTLIWNGLIWIGLTRMFPQSENHISQSSINLTNFSAIFLFHFLTLFIEPKSSHAPASHITLFFKIRF